MRILILSQYFLPEMGAPQSRLFELAKGLISLGWEVSVVTAMPNYPTGRIFKSHRNKFSHIDSIDNIEIKRYWLFPSNSSKALPRVISMLSFSITSLFSIYFVRKKKPNYVFIESPPLTLAFSGWLLSKASSSRMILNISDLWPLSAKELGAIKDGMLYSLLLKLEYFMYRKAFMRTGQSQEIVDYISKIIPENSYLFRNGVDIERFDGTGFDPTKRNHFVYAGLLGVAQGILSICKNVDFKALNAEFHIFGSGAEQEEITAYLKEHPNRGILYNGILSRNELPQKLSSYGGTVIPLTRKIYGAVPSKIYEAMAAGLPIIFSGKGEGASIIRDANAGWVNCPGDWDDFRNSIKEFLSLREDEYFEMRARNRGTARLKFHRKKQIAELSKLLIGKLN